MQRITVRLWDGGAAASASSTGGVGAGGGNPDVDRAAALGVAGSGSRAAWPRPDGSRRLAAAGGLARFRGRRCATRREQRRPPSDARRCRWRSRGRASASECTRHCVQVQEELICSVASSAAANWRWLWRSVSTAAATGAVALSLKPEQAGASMRRLEPSQSCGSECVSRQKWGLVLRCAASVT